VWVGYKILTIGIQADDDVFDHVFSDIALAAAARLGSIGGGWSLAASAGLGTSNDGRFDNVDALYGVASLQATCPVGATSRWRVGLSLDQNRVLLPNVPLPYGAYESEADPDLRFSLGTLASEIAFRPWTPITVVLRWDYPVNARGSIEADLGKGWSLFAEGERRYDGFHQWNQGETRLFYLFHSAEAGIRWKSPLGLLSLSGGSAFAQRFDVGYDLRDRKRLDAPENGPLVALTVSGTF
jgi:hypothetical protein